MDYSEEKDFNNNQGYEIHSAADASVFPNDCVGIIYQRQYGSLKVVGTGFLVASDLVLTVAHNAYLRDQHKKHEGLIFYPGVSGPLTTSTGYKVIDSRHRQEYFTCQYDQIKYYDYALLKIEHKIIKKEYCQLGLNYKGQKQLLGVIGYRGLACNPKNAGQSSVWWADQHKVDGPILKHKLSTLNGVSGSPLLVKRQNKNIVIGIHFGVFNNQEYNGGRIITDDLFCDLVCWEKQMSSQIKFRLMKDNASEIQTVQIQQRLKSIQKKVGVYLTAFNQPSFQSLRQQLQKLKAKNKQDKHIQVQEDWLYDLVQKLEAMPLAQKQQITSLTLKVNVQQNRVLFGIIQLQLLCDEVYYLEQFRCNYFVMKRIIWNNLGVITL